MNFSNIISPLDQFEIRNLVSLDAPVLGNLSISLTNIGLYLTIAGVLVFTISLLSNNNNRVVSNAWSVYQESIYATVHSIVVSQINDKKGQVYFPFMYVLFLFILVNNLIGLVPYSFASTSHFILTFSISFIKIFKPHQQNVSIIFHKKQQLLLQVLLYKVEVLD